MAADFLGRFEILQYLQRPAPATPEVAVVVQARSRATGRVVVIKFIRAECYHDNEVRVPQLVSPRAQPHPNIMPVLYTHRVADCGVYIVTDYAARGDLFHNVSCGLVGRTELEATGIAVHVLSAVAPLHERNILHADIKLENFVVDDDSNNGSKRGGGGNSSNSTSASPPPPAAVVGPSNFAAAAVGTGGSSDDPVAHAQAAAKAQVPKRTGGIAVKLIDFGLCRHVGVAGLALERVLGTEGYIAPEVVRGGVVTTAADVWSIGVLLYNLFKRASLCKLAGCKGETCARQLRAAALDRVFAGVSPTMRRLIRECLREDPASRPTVPQLAARLLAYRRTLAAAAFGTDAGGAPRAEAHLDGALDNGGG